MAMLEMLFWKMRQQELITTQVRDNKREQFSFCILQHIATVMKRWLPNLNEAQEMIDNNVVDIGKNITTFPDILELISCYRQNRML
jgi:hypothetical protein